MPRAPLTILALAFALGACSTDLRYDFDRDGWEDAEDCAPEDPETHPDAPDPFGDDHDSDCDGVDGEDADGDGFPGNAPEGSSLWDCDDADDAVHPDAEEVPGDGIDNDCVDGDPADGDLDGYSVEDGDCDDADPQVHPGAPDVMDCLDNDCDGAVDVGWDTADGDGDGYCVGADVGAGAQCCDGSTVGDCDDDQADVFPGAEQTCDGNTDDDCDGVTAPNETDDDGDSWTECLGDCDDDEPAAHPGASAACDGIDDNNCDDQVDLAESDDAGDGFSASNQRQLIFGLGKATKIDEVTIRWPSGRDQTLQEVAIDTEVMFIEGHDEPLSIVPALR